MNKKILFIALLISLLLFGRSVSKDPKTTALEPIQAHEIKETLQNDCPKDTNHSTALDDPRVVVEKGDLVTVEYSYDNKTEKKDVLVGEYLFPEKVETCLLEMKLHEEKEFTLTREEGTSHRFRVYTQGRDKISLYLEGDTAPFKIKVLDLVKSYEEDSQLHSISNSEIENSSEGPVFGGVQFSSYEAGMKSSEISGKPVFIYFWSESCYWCKKFEEEVLTNEGIKNRLNESFIPVAVDFDREKNLTGKYTVSVTPTLIFLDRSGSVLNKIIGYRDTNLFLGDLEAALN